MSIEGISDQMTPKQDVTVNVTREDSTTFSFTTTARLDSAIEIDYYRNGGILPAVLRNLLSAEK
jgi:aconitate hydratase